MSFLDIRSVETCRGLSKLEKKGGPGDFVDYDDQTKKFSSISTDKVFRKLDDEPQKNSYGIEKWTARSEKVFMIIAEVSSRIASSGKGAFLAEMQNCGAGLNNAQFVDTSYKSIDILDELRRTSLEFLLKGKDQKSGLQPITCGEVTQAMDRANAILNKHYEELRPKILGRSQGKIEEKPETGKADARTSGATTTTSSSVKAKGVSNVETGGGKVSTKDAEKKPRLLSSFKAFTSTALPKQTDPEHKQKVGRYKSELKLYEAGQTHRPEPPEKKEKLPIVGKLPAPFDRESDEDQLSHDDDLRQGKNEHTPDGKVKQLRTDNNLSEAENEQSRTGYGSDHAHSEASDGDDARIGPNERLSATTGRVRKKLEDTGEQTTQGPDQKRKRDPDDPPSGSEGYLY